MSSFSGRYIFIAGLHRTGTSLVSKIIGGHSRVAAIANSPAPENEGCYLQGAIPHTAQHGIPGHYAIDPAQHHIEGCQYDTARVRDRLTSDWDRWYETPGNWRVEKSPVNLTRMRLYQQLFPLCQFVIVLRHPEAMASALGKWTKQPPRELIGYALTAYQTMLDDFQYLHCAYIIRYEDLLTQPSAVVTNLYSFLGLKPESFPVDLRDGNAEYCDAAAMTQTQDHSARIWGYRPNLTVSAMQKMLNHPLRAIREAVL